MGSINHVDICYHLYYSLVDNIYCKKICYAIGFGILFILFSEVYNLIFIQTSDLYNPFKLSAFIYGCILGLIIHYCCNIKIIKHHKKYI